MSESELVVEVNHNSEHVERLERRTFAYAGSRVAFLYGAVTIESSVTI